MSSFLTGMEISSSGLAAQRTRMNIVSSNLANARTTRTQQGGPYRRLQPVFEAGQAQESFAGHLNRSIRTVQVAGIEQDPRPFQEVYDPGHPDANALGYVQMPNVNIMEEMVSMITATRSYEANATAFESLKNMANRAINIG
ncbi:MAG: flagellar basal body rod protein FlgC [Myxococcales bacterium]|nr:flagellar basal body rod protein FlgC [Myxococcales bacterium]